MINDDNETHRSFRCPDADRIHNSVKARLRNEVNFGCPVANCGSPFLTFHHFDPPKHIEKHNNEAGMIALCHHHHDIADGPTPQYTKQQMRNMKENPFIKDRLKCEWIWQPESLLVLLGTMAFIGPRSVLMLQDVEVVAVRRETVPNLNLAVMRVDFDLRAKDGTAIATMKDNIFEAFIDGLTVEAPPKGRSLHLLHSSGATLSLELKAYEPNILRDMLNKAFGGKRDIANVVATEALSRCIDSDGNVPVLKIRGTFFQRGADLQFTAKYSKLTARKYGVPETADIGHRLFYPGSSLGLRYDGVDILRFG